jgi:hypothetical protein
MRCRCAVKTKKLFCVIIQMSRSSASDHEHVQSSLP